MIALIKRTVLILTLIVAFTSCNQGPTLQTYYVDNELKPGFTTLDVPASFVDIDQTTLTEEQKEAYNSVDKLNMLAFVLDQNNEEQYKVELAKVKTILKDPKYQELMRGGNSTDGKFQIKYIGGENDDEIDELVIFGSANERGFALIRILGDNMNPSKLMKLSSVIQNADFKTSDANQFLDFFK
ncbi:DUF4252 domain-containing protein [Winogradskyella sp. 3972H.M.0a.05]|uniref:DUF4252 domain-containing protein n=1 Tax=Winogradskyella sp. 3972H.M.0a.05 TaxID=2950277 RepID=UPI0033978D77